MAEFLTLAREVAGFCPNVAVEPCFLELAQPNFAEGVDRAVGRGVRRLTVMPLLLFAAGHAKRDIPRDIATAAARHPGVSIRQAGHLGCHEAVLTLSERRCHEALSPFREVPDRDTLLLLVGRGSNDAEATREMVRFSQLRHQRQPVGRLENCFLALAEPSLEQALVAIASLPYSRVIVQPHLLFLGELLDRVHRSIAATAAEQPRREWIVTCPLGGDPGLAQAILEIAGVGTRDGATRP